MQLKGARDYKIMRCVLRGMLGYARYAVRCETAHKFDAVG